MAMPKTAINEYSEFCFLENKIRFTQQRKVAPPAANVGQPQKGN